MKFDPLYYADKLKVINPEGHSGIVTLWTPPLEYRKRLEGAYPQMFEQSSPLVALTSLYGNGIPQMLANLANNPQIERIAITGTEMPAVRSGEAFTRFFSEGVESVMRGDVSLSQIKGTTYSLDPQLRPEIFNPRLKVQKFAITDLEGIVNFVGAPREGTYEESQRVPVTLAKPSFNDFPSNQFGHNVYAKTPTDAWMEVLHRINRFGKNVQLEKGLRRALYNLDVYIDNPSFESEDTLKRLNLDPKSLRAYQEGILSSELGDQPYNYGHRFGKYFGKDLVERVVELFKEDPMNRRSFITTWDNVKDPASEQSAPCLSDIYFAKVDDKLALTASFRTHNAVSAWMDNVYGLRAIQEKVANSVSIPAGPINVRSRWIGIDPGNANTIAALEIVKNNRKKRIDVDDPIGYFVVEARKDEIVAAHHDMSGVLLEEFSGPDAKTIKDQMRQVVAVIEPDHAMWIGHELARAEYELRGKVSEIP